MIAHMSLRGIAQLEMDLEGPAPEGVITPADGPGYPFSGWTELAAAIEKWRFQARSARSPGEGGDAREGRSGQASESGGG